jgi:hypothetical protein
MIAKLLAFVAIVVAMVLIATVAVADKRQKTEALRRAHRIGWLCSHGRADCGTLDEQVHRASIESDWNNRERFYICGIAAGLAGCGVLIGLEIRSRRRAVGRLA